MSVTSVERLPSGRKGPTVDIDGTRELSEIYVVRTNSASDTGFTVLAGVGLPAYGSAHPEYPAALAYRATPTQHPDSEKVWHVEVFYSTMPLDPRTGSTKDASKKPWERGAKISWEFRERDIYPLKDRLNSAWVNSIGDPLVDRPSIIKANPVAVVQIDQSSYDPDQAARYAYTVNSGDWPAAGKWPSWCVLCHPWTATEAWEQNTRYWQVTYRFEIDIYSWLPKPAAPTNALMTSGFFMNVGHRYKNANGKIVPYVDDNGVAGGDPVMLKQDGMWTRDPNLMHWLRFFQYEAKDFTAVTAFEEFKDMLL